MIGIQRRLVWLIVGGFRVLRGVGAEQHKVRFNNQCGYGTPHLLKDGNILSQGEEFVSNGSFTSGIAYLQTGDCNLNGEGCTLVEMTLINPACPGCGSSVDISLIPPLAYSVPTSFSYFNGCDGNGAACSSPGCGAAFYTPNDDRVQVQCEEHDVDLLIAFCAESTASTPSENTATAMTYSSATEKVQPTDLSMIPGEYTTESTDTTEDNPPTTTTTPRGYLGAPRHMRIGHRGRRLF